MHCPPWRSIRRYQGSNSRKHAPIWRYRKIGPLPSLDGHNSLPASGHAPAALVHHSYKSPRALNFLHLDVDREVCLGIGRRGYHPQVRHVALHIARNNAWPLACNSLNESDHTKNGPSWRDRSGSDIEARVAASFVIAVFDESSTSCRPRRHPCSTRLRVPAPRFRSPLAHRKPRRT